MKIVERFSVQNDCYKNNVNRVDTRYRRFQDEGPKGLMLHSVGCPQPSAEVFANGWNHSGKQVAVHAVGQADGLVYQCLPWNYRAWHCGGAANNTHVGVEMTEPDCITYTGGANFVCSNLTRARSQATGTYNTMVELFAMLCKQYGLDPLRDIISHAEGAARGIASGHADPQHLWSQLGLPYSMDTFRAAVAAKMKGEEEMTKEEITALIDKRINTLVPQMIARMIADHDKVVNDFSEVIPSLQAEVRQLLDCGAINGGSPATVNPDDIKLPYQDLRVCVIAKRYADQLLKK